MFLLSLRQKLKKKCKLITAWHIDRLQHPETGRTGAAVLTQWYDVMLALLHQTVCHNLQASSLGNRAVKICFARVRAHVGVEQDNSVDMLAKQASKLHKLNMQVLLSEAEVKANEESVAVSSGSVD